MISLFTLIVSSEVVVVPKVYPPVDELPTLAKEVVVPSTTRPHDLTGGTRLSFLPSRLLQTQLPFILQYLFPHLWYHDDYDDDRISSLVS